MIRRDGQIDAKIPCEDIGVVLVDHPRVTYSHTALSTLTKAGAVLLLCDQSHLPTSILLPMADHSQVVWRLNDQINASKPLRKTLWKQIVQAKIRRQATVASNPTARSKLLDMAKNVRSGDPANMEAQAARVYWRNYLPDETFRRDSDGNELNSFLNYGYAVIRAAVARAIVAAGFLPAIGLHHRNRSNAFCLADDLMEPLRPLVDDRARDLYVQGYRDLTTEAKAGLLELLTLPVKLKGDAGPLMVKLHQMAGSLAACYQGKAKQLLIPEHANSQVSSIPTITDNQTTQETSPNIS